MSNWSDGITTAFDITVTSPLTPVCKCHTWNCCTTGRAEEALANDTKCHMLGWKCTPLAAESYESWGSEARQDFSHLASRLSFGLGIQKPKTDVWEVEHSSSEVQCQSPPQ